MKLHRAFIVFRKEMREMLRDRRMIVTSIIMPILLYPLLMIGMSAIMSRQEQKLESEQSVIAIHDTIKDHVTQSIADSLGKSMRFKVLPGVTNEQKLLENGAVQAELTITRQDSIPSEWLHTNQAVNDSITSKYTLYRVDIRYDKANDKSKVAADKLGLILNRLEKHIVADRLTSRSIPEYIFHAFDIREINIASSQKMLGFMVGRILPYFLIILLLSSSSVIAMDIVAGEKERKTLETLLVSAACRSELVLGKFLTTVAFALVSVLINLFSMYLSMKHLLVQSGVDMSEISLPLSNFALLLVAMLPLLTLVAALLISLSTFARNMKEAGTYLSPIMILFMLMSMIAFIPGIDLNPGLALIPVINISLLFKEIMLDQFNLLNFLITVGSTILLDIVAIWGTVKLFSSEKILFRVEEEQKPMKLWGKNRTNLMQPGYAVLLFALVILGLFYLGSAWQARDFVVGMFKTQIILILLPPLLLLQVSKIDYKRVFGFSAPKPVNLLLVIGMAIPIFVLTSQVVEIINWVYPFPEGYMERFAGQFDPLIKQGIWMTLLVMAVLPGICEEFLNRGFIFHSMRGMGSGMALGVSSLLFGIMHLDPYRLLPTGLLGLWIGFLYYRSKNFYVPMLAHFGQNAITALFLMYGKDLPGFGIYFSDDHFAPWLAPVSLVVLALMFWVFLKINPKPDEKAFRQGL